MGDYNPPLNVMLGLGGVAITTGGAPILTSPVTISGATAQLIFQAAGPVNRATFVAPGTGTPAIKMTDPQNGPWDVWQYNAGAIGAGQFIFNGTLDASSSTVAANVMSGGLAVAKSAQFGTTVTTVNGNITANTTAGQCFLIANGFTNAGVILNAATGSTPSIYMRINSVSQYILGMSATQWFFEDAVAGTFPLTYNQGTIGACFFTFAGTLDASSSTVAANVMSGGLAVAKNINNAGTITTSGGAIILTGQITIESAGAAATNDTISHIYRTNGTGSGDFSVSGNVIIQPRTATATPMDFIVYTGATTGVEHLRVLSTGVCRLGGATVPSANTFAGNIIWGRNTAAADTAGAIGETISSSVTAVAMGATTVTANVTSVSLTAGKWLVWGMVVFHGGATGFTAASTVQASAAVATAATGTTGQNMAQESVLSLLANGLFTLTILPFVVNISATASQFLTAVGTYSAGAPTVDGTIFAERIA